MILGRLVPGHRVEVRVGADERLLRLRLGTTDVSVFDEVVVRGEYDFAAPGSVATVVDAGANIGITAAWYVARYPGCRVVAIEPEPANYALLAENVADRPEISAVHAALWPESGRVCVDNPDAGAWEFRMRAARDTDHRGAVRAVTVAEILDDHAIDRLDLLKIDIEGAERELFSGDIGFLDRVDAIAIELHDRERPGCSRAFFGALTGFPYEAWRGNTVLVARSGP